MDISKEEFTRIYRVSREMDIYYDKQFREKNRYI